MQPQIARSTRATIFDGVSSEGRTIPVGVGYDIVPTSRPPISKNECSDFEFIKLDMNHLVTFPTHNGNRVK